MILPHANPQLSAVPDATLSRWHRYLSEGQGSSMRVAEVRLAGWRIADAIAELAVWLDCNDCTPQSFEIAKAAAGLVVRVEFADNTMAEAFQREFAR